MLIPLDMPTLLAADVVHAGWVDGLAPLVVLIVYVVRQIMSALSEQREAERAKREAAEAGLNPLGDPPPAEAKQAGAQGELRSEVDEFLRRVSENRQDGDPAPAQPEPKRKGPVDPFEEPPRRRVRKPKPTKPAPAEVELLLDPDPAPSQTPRPKQLPATHARGSSDLRRLPESQLAENSAHLGEEIARAEQRAESRLHEKFDHRLGKLESGSDASTPATDQPQEASGATRIKQLLSRPGGVREAVILSEILRPRGDQL